MPNLPYIYCIISIQSIEAYAHTRRKYEASSTLIPDIIGFFRFFQRHHSRLLCFQQGKGICCQKACTWDFGLIVWAIGAFAYRRHIRFYCTL